MEALITELKKHIIEVLNLEDLQPEDIDDGEGLWHQGEGSFSW